MGFCVQTYVLPLILSAPLRFKFMSHGKRASQHLAEVPTGNLFLWNIFGLLTMEGIGRGWTSQWCDWLGFGSHSHTFNVITGPEEVTFPCGH